jgi:hypothetical protein
MILKSRKDASVLANLQEFMKTVSIQGFIKYSVLMLSLVCIAAIGFLLFGLGKGMVSFSISMLLLLSIPAIAAILSQKIMFSYS